MEPFVLKCLLPKAAQYYRPAQRPDSRPSFGSSTQAAVQSQSKPASSVDLFVKAVRTLSGEDEEKVRQKESVKY